MSNDLFGDIANMHAKFSVNTVADSLNPQQLYEYVKFRTEMINEENTEMNDAWNDVQRALLLRGAIPDEDFNKKFQTALDSYVDAIIDGMVFQIGTLDVLRIDGRRAWNAVHAANMVKTPGVKASRPNKFGFPDLVKPKDWCAPSHLDNLGRLSDLQCVAPNKISDI